MFRALAFDLDGTLLLPDETLSPRTLTALAAAKDAGYTLIVASARWRQLAVRIAEEIGTAAPMVACSGAQVFDPTTGKDLLDLRLPAEFSAALYAICDRERCIATIVLDEDVVVHMEGEPDPAELPPEMVWAPSLAGRATSLPRIALIQGSGTVAMIREQLAEQWAGRVRFVESISSRGKSILTLTAKGADKGAALEIACGHIGISTRDVLVFGDAENDLEMFRVAGGSVAMGQAAEHVRANATHTTASNLEDGVALAVERLLRGELGA